MSRWSLSLRFSLSLSPLSSPLTACMAVRNSPSACITTLRLSGVTFTSHMSSGVSMANATTGRVPGVAALPRDLKGGG